jgi:acyl-CoA hydrolase
MIKKIADSFTIMTEMIMPNDTNPLGNLMGGNLLRLMDIAGAICAGRHCEAYVVTASVDHVSFTEPIHLGEVITLECSVTRAWTTSVEVYVEVWAADVRGKERHKCNHAYFTFVGLDAYTKKPTPVSAVEAINEEQKLRFDAAERRREVRLILAGRMKPSEASNLKALFGED